MSVAYRVAVLIVAKIYKVSGGKSITPANFITVYPFICERVNRYTVNFVVMLTTSATYGKMFLDRKGCGRRWIVALKESGNRWRLRAACGR